jgi:hypothetical protein
VLKSMTPAATGQRDDECRGSAPDTNLKEGRRRGRGRPARIVQRIAQPRRRRRGRCLGLGRPGHEPELHHSVADGARAHYRRRLDPQGHLRRTPLRRGLQINPSESSSRRTPSGTAPAGRTASLGRGVVDLRLSGGSTLVPEGSSAVGVSGELPALQHDHRKQLRLPRREVKPDQAEECRNEPHPTPPVREVAA